MARRITILAVAAAFAIVPSRAAADVVVRGMVEAGPTFAGEDLLWAKRYRDGRLALVASRAGGRAQQLFTVPEPPVPPAPGRTTSKWVAQIAASSSRLAFEYGGGWRECSGGGSVRASSPTCGVAGYSRLMSGPLEGPYAQLSGDREDWGCEQERTAPGGLAIEGSMLAYGETTQPCEAQGGDIRVVVRDMSDTAAEPRVFGGLLAGPPPDVALVGSRVAWLESWTDVPKAHVADWTTGERLYSVRLPPGHTSLREVELTEDGRALIVSSNQRETRSAISIASESHPRPLKVVSAPQIESLRVAGERLFAVRRFGKQRWDDTYPRFETFVAGFGGQITPLRRHGSRTHLTGQPDFDGRRAAWAVVRRDGKRRTGLLRVVDVAGAEAR